MRRVGNNTMRGMIRNRFLVVSLIPVLLFAIFSQVILSQSQRTVLEEQMENNLRNTDRALDMVLDKYATILYDLCTDDEMIELVSLVNQDEDTLKANSSALRHELSHICNRNVGIEGITMQLASGDIIFYDSLNASSTNSEWAGSVEIPQVEQGEVYRSLTEPIVTEGSETYLFQVARNVIDYRNIHEVLGTVVISVNEEEVRDALGTVGDSTVYLLDGDRIISAPDVQEIGNTVSYQEDTYENRYAATLNETSGFLICTVQPLQAYHRTVAMQIILLCIIAMAAMVLMTAFIYQNTKPYLKVVDHYIEAMNRLEEGDFTVRAETPQDLPVEIYRIGYGFNEMVIHIEQLIEQVKQASMDQRNAELSVLEAQIDPHFLYNTLDTINWKAIEQEQYEISELLGALADIMRYTVKNAGGTTTLSQEIAWLRQYILLQGVRLNHQPELEVHMPEELQGFRIHKLLLQPFVENAIKHGFKYKEERGVITIRARQAENQVHIVIEDNGAGINAALLQELNSETSDAGDHVGIANVRQRLKLYYGEEAAVFFESAEGSYTRAHLFIPEKEETVCES